MKLRISSHSESSGKDILFDVSVLDFYSLGELEQYIERHSEGNAWSIDSAFWYKDGAKIHYDENLSLEELYELANGVQDYGDVYEAFHNVLVWAGLKTYM